MRLLLLVSASALLTLGSTPYGDVTIRRDTFGIPHIHAGNERAASFGLGYAQAEDHCVEIAKRFISARGAAHEAFGGPIESDFRIHQFRNMEVSESLYRKLPALYKGLIDSYVAGVNLYLSQHRAALPKWVPDAFTGTDIIALTRSGGLAGIGTIANAPDLRSVVPPPPVREPEGEQSDADGSNAFALHGSRTKSGSPILVGNPHLSWSSLYWEAHVTVPGVINFYGSTLPGIPVLRAGFNERLGWVNTNNSPDLVDVFFFQEDPKKSGNYLYKGRSHPLTQREVAIAGQKRTFADTHLGPVLQRKDGKIYVVQSAGVNAVRYYEGFYRLSKTKTLAEFKKVMDLNLIPFSHFTYADADGNIFYAWNAHLPVRVADGTDYTKPVPAEPRYMWKRYHRFSDFPQLQNPTGGYIMNSNDPPWYTNLRQRMDPEKYPKYFERGDLRLRSQSILEKIDNDAKHDIDSAMTMKFNTKVLLADRIKADLVRVLREAGEKDPAEVLAAWDNHVGKDSRGAVLFLAFFQAYQTRTKKPYAVAFDAANPAKTPSGLGDPAAAVEAMKQAAANVLKRWGRLDIGYGEANRFRFKGRDMPGDGASGVFGVYKVQTFNVDASDGRNAAGWVSAEKPLLGFGDAWVLAVEFTQPVRAFSVVPYGETTNQESRHCCDQIDYFANHKLRPVWFTEADIKAHIEREYKP